ncbi:MAG: O-antigen ligase family protein [Sulfobacillus sp.]
MILLLVVSLLLSMSFGALAAFFGGIPALILFAPILPIILVLKDYRVGIVMLMLLTAFQSTPFLPHFSGFNIVNYLTAATLGALVLTARFNRLPAAPFPRYIVWSYLVPVTLAAIHGIPYVRDLPSYLAHEAYRGPVTYIDNLLIKPLLLLLLSWMLGTALLNSQHKERFLIPLVIAPLLPAIAVLVYIGLGGFDLGVLASPQGRTILSKLGIFSNNLGILLSTGFSILLFMLPETTGRTRAGLFVSITLIAMALVLTFSRGSYLIAVLAIAYFIKRNRQIKTSLVVVVLLVISALPFSHAIYRRVSTGLSSQTDSTMSAREQLTSGRIWIWRHVMPDIANHPLVGSGMGSTAWSKASLEGLIHLGNPQNLYLLMLMDMGVIGTILVLFFYWSVLRTFHRLANSPDMPRLFSGVFRGAWIGFIGMLIGGGAYGNYMTTVPQTYLWLTFGMALAFLPRESRVSPKKAVRLGNTIPRTFGAR